MATSSNLFTITLGSPVTASTTVTLVGTGSTGTRGALRRLTHPDSSNFPPITYYSNPDRTFNLDNDVLFGPRSAAILTEGTTKVVRRETGIDDVIVTEIWNAEEGNKVAMPTSFFRKLYEYVINPPAFSATAQTYIQWEPRERNAETYNVELFRIVVGGGFENNQLFDVVDFKQPGGLFDGGSIKNPLDLEDVVETGVLDRTVILQMKIVSKV